MSPNPFHSELLNAIDTFHQAKVLVVGDAMLDIYEHCVVRRISPEAPVPVASITDDIFFLGGAGNVVQNVQALGGFATFVSVLGNDESGKDIMNLLCNQSLPTQGLFVENDRITTQKKRVIAGTQHLIRIDREMTHAIHTETEKAICIFLENEIPKHDVVIISDYAKGLITDGILATIRTVGLRDDKKVLIDSKGHNFSRYADFYLIKPNREEAEFFAGEKFSHTYENLEAIGKKLRNSFRSNIVITLGGDGIALFEAEDFVHTKTAAQEVFDVSGAGDTVLATIAIAVAVGIPLKLAMHLSNHAAGHVVSKLGTTTCSAEVLRNRLQETL